MDNELANCISFLEQLSSSYEDPLSEVLLYIINDAERLNYYRMCYIYIEIVGLSFPI